MGIGSVIFRFRWAVIAAWAAAVVLLALTVPAPDPAANERATLLPDETDYGKATRAFQNCFPSNSGLSEAVVVFERTGRRLTPADLDLIEQIARRIRLPAPPEITRADLRRVTVRSPRSVALPKNPLTGKPLGQNPLIGGDGRAGLITVNIPSNFITLHSAKFVRRIRSILQDAKLPAGLGCAVTGSSGFGYDYAEAGKRSHRRTFYVTLIAVIVILLVVYRAPVASLVPLVAISAAAAAALSLLAIGQHFGMHIGTAERIFVVVLMYGAGIDYSLFFISRFREYLGAGKEISAATGEALNATFPAILASAGTDTAGLLMLCFAGYSVFRTTGPAVAIALVTALLSAVTLVPALVGVCGRWLFWPGRTPSRIGIGRQWLWPRVGRLATTRPGIVLVAILLVLGIPAARGAKLRWVYDALAAVKPDRDQPVGNSARGLEMVRRHWPAGQIAPVQVLIRQARPLDTAAWREMSQRLTRGLGSVAGVCNVRSLSRPLGKNSGAAAQALASTLGRRRVLAEYLSRDHKAVRLIVLIDKPAFTLEAMATVGEIRLAAETLAGENADIHVAGATAETIDIRRTTQKDFYRVAALSLVVIFVIVLVLLRDLILTAFMVASTVLGYLAALGVSYWVFAGLFGDAGLDWKVEVFLFVVMVAVGVDYNIFLVSRLIQEARRYPLREAAERAIIHTGPVISSCGVIMAATLGSLMAADLKLLRELGFALALGMLIETFLIRPLLLPAAVVLARRTVRSGKLIG
ncbi:MAG: MMPL family transporter [Planctomycetota bacterium]|nr:MMPL family transporter [Planctomycetota bacterium]